MAAVVDAAACGLASFLERAFPGRVRPFVFTQASKSQLGWDFIAAVETGRYKEYVAMAGKGGSGTVCSYLVGSGAGRLGRGGSQTRLNDAGMETLGLQDLFWREVTACEGVVQAGPGQLLRWGVPDGRRDTQTGEVLHDDLLVSAALCVVLDNEPVGRAVSVVIPPKDIFEGFRPVY
jgi:hypothetical protein